jgi:two-component system, OmpR family, response regulator
MTIFTSSPTCQSWTQRKIATAGTTPRVLVVDDYPGAADALATYLVLEGLASRVATSGVETMISVQSWMPDIVVLDIHMPNCDGFATARALRKNELTAAIGIVAFTALDAPAVRHRATQGDFDGYCQKGVAPIVILALLRSLF